MGVHLVRLCMMLERSLSPERANAAMVRVTKVEGEDGQARSTGEFGAVTVAD